MRTGSEALVSGRRNIAAKAPPATAVLFWVLLGIAALVGVVGCDRDARATAERADAELRVIEIRGTRRGPTVAFVAGVHGGKVAAVNALERLAGELDPDAVVGTVLIVAPANLAGFRAGLAQLSPDDSLNLNRVFPGNEDGRPTERLAARIMKAVVARSDYLVDLHGSDGDESVGRFAYAARPGIDPRVDSAARALAVAWGVPLIVWDDAGPRTLAESRFLQTAAHLSGVPAITVFEAGETREDSSATTAFVAGARRTLYQLGVLDASMEQIDPLATDTSAIEVAVLPRRSVALAERDGVWNPVVRAGARVRRGELLGTVVDSLTSTLRPLRAQADGIVLHQRHGGDVAAATPVVILGVIPATRP